MSGLDDRPPHSARAAIAFGPYVLDPLRAELRRDGRPLPLRRKTFDLLLALAGRPGEVLGKDELLATLWPGVVVGDDSLAQCVHELRAALGADGAAFVRTVPRRGYRFDAEAPVDRAPAATPPAQEAAPFASAPPLQTGATEPPKPMAVRRRHLALAAGQLALVTALAIQAWHRAPADAPRVPPLSLVLLPLEVQDPEQTPSWFAEALTADLTAEFGRMANALVIARATAAAWRNPSADPREVARALGVRYVVRGTVRRADDQVQLALALVDGATGAQQWAERFELERTRLGPALDDVVQQVARRLNVEMYRAAGDRAAALSPGQVKADDLAMQAWGRYFHGNYSRETLFAALALSEQAVAKDPRSVMGWGGVAIFNGLGAAFRWLPDRDAGIARLAEASARLQELDAEHLFTLLAKGHEANLRDDPEAGILIAKMTLERYPNHAPSYGTLAVNLMRTGHFDACRPPLERALRLSPRDPMVSVWHCQLAICEYMRGDPARAEQHARNSMEISIAQPLSPLVLAASLAEQGRVDAARTVLGEYRRRNPEDRLEKAALLMAGRQADYAAGRERLFATLRELGMP